MNRILVRVLLAPENISQRLAGTSGGFKDETEHPKYFGMAPKLPDSRILIVQVVDALPAPVFVALDFSCYRVIYFMIYLVEQRFVEKIGQDDVAMGNELFEALGLRA